ncbi:MAG: prohead protease/major capsid protein fusion protein [Myxococcota bacterium]
MNRELEPSSTRATVGAIDLKKRTVEVVWTTGAKVLRSSWADGPFWEELSTEPAHVRLERLNSGRAPFLMNHDGGNVAATLGVVESARLESGRGVATVRFVAEGVDAEADKVFAKIADKIIRNVSVGYRTWAIEKTESADGTVPTHLAIDWEPYEISAVAIGADAGAGFRSAAKSNPVRVTTRTNTNEVQNMFKRKKLQEQDKGDGGGSSAGEEIGARAERERVVGIQHSVRTAKLDPAFGEKLITEGVSLDNARKRILDELAKRSDEVQIDSRITVGESDGERWQRHAVAWLLEKSGNAGMVQRAIETKVRGFSERDLEGDRFRGYTVLDLAREALERRGVRTTGKSRQTIMGEALTQRSAYAGTSDFPTLLENVMGKILLGAYAVTPDTWSAFCKKDVVPDFRDAPRYRTGAFSTLDVVAENAEYKNKPIPDGAKTTISTETRGNIIGISRQALINDDMGALGDMLTRLARAAKLSIEASVYALLAQNGGLGPTMSDSNPFFHSTRGNVNGTGSALTVAGLDADRVILAAQKDLSGVEYLDLRPHVLLVPSGLGGTARVLNNSQYDPDAANKLQLPNKVAGLFRTVVDTARLSGTRRYLFADPAITPAIVVAFLEGQGESPYLETQDGWRVDGVEFKVRHDFRVNAFDPKGAITNAGA